MFGTYETIAPTKMYMARSPHLCCGGMDGQIGVLQIDVMPFEAKELAASETGVQ